MRAAYDALVRRSQPLAYWPLGRHGPRDVVAGADFATGVTYRRPTDGDGSFLGVNEIWSRGIVMTATNNFTVEIWFRPDSMHGGGAGVWQNANGGSNGYAVDIPGVANTGDFRFRAIAQSVAILAVSARPMIYRQWNHIVVVRNAGTWSYYLNGNLDTANAGTNAPITPSVTTAIKSATSGQADVRGFAMYTRVLTGDEIRDHWLAGMEDAPLILIGGTTTTDSDITPPFIDSTTVLYDQMMDRPVFILPLLLRWSQN